ncbi:hypothetical protein PR003_g31744 [Phytophthora rubi]|uniref:Secreted peptide n=1 Tax=Phytophthora rubi TaxID=129364 RepID=A0A6A3J653_9STRA|nr:hypothetical protein PR002_g21972 [Phytophthora rubi]KAE8991106.1 hypothetical protein PR001_g21321 [Phytophthora rubi]KAE9267530.1 hypothetical protein PR003_g31744 [Phytophthora rubi]
MLATTVAAVPWVTVVTAVASLGSVTPWRSVVRSAESARCSCTSLVLVRSCEVSSFDIRVFTVAVIALETSFRLRVVLVLAHPSVA